MGNPERCPLLLFGCLSLLVCCIMGGYEHKCSSSTYSQVPKGALCGRKLADAVSLVCGGLANIHIPNGGRKKREAYDELDNYQKRSDMKTLNSATKGSHSARRLLLDKRNAVSYLKKRNLIDEKGIVCECCYNTCELIELLEYCSYN